MRAIAPLSRYNIELADFNNSLVWVVIVAFCDKKSRPNIAVPWLGTADYIRLDQAQLIVGRDGCHGGHCSVVEFIINLCI